jgi:hypothetical protein
MGISFSKSFFSIFQGKVYRRKGTMQPVTEDTFILVQIEEVKCTIRKLSFVTVLSPVRAVPPEENSQLSTN